MSDLAAGDFEAFHLAVHGKEPFAWQSRLLRQVAETRKWPRVLDLPTGSGKTTCVDIALFALALDADGATTRWCPRRIAMVVDRRIVVDQVAERGRKLLRALLTEDSGDVVREVSRRLTALSRDAGDPIGVFTLRGGMPKDDGWARTPEQPLILASTVDQLGSRLLVQGYGVSDSMKPVHAGLLGNDTLLLLDEVHLSQPFAETLDALDRLRNRFTATSGLAPRFCHAFLSATPGPSGAEVFRLNKDEMSPGSALGPRLHVGKPTRLIDAADRVALEATCVAEARRLIVSHDVVAVIVNRVGSASNISRTLGVQTGTAADVVMLTGRMRPIDRDDVLLKLRPRVATGRNRSTVDRKLIVVGTQSLEAGADFDFDVLVTEAASLDALRQRFGRVDRLGEYEKAEGVVIRDKSAKIDPIYEEAATRTVAWLKRHIEPKSKTIDFGVLALPVPVADEREGLIAPKPHAPVLLPAYMDLWMQTSPKPAATPDVSLWLHGPKSGPADVQVVWRVDLSDADLADRATATAVASAIRPSSLEAMSLPFLAARRWLGGQPSGDISDVEGDQSELGDETAMKPARALRWNGSDSEIIGADELRPSDTIVVPATRGGICDGCFDPDSKDVVSDLAERASLIGRGQPVLRLHPQVLKQLDLPAVHDLDSDDAIEAFWAYADQSSLSGWRRVWLENLFRAGRRPLAIVVHRGQASIVLQGRRLSKHVLRGLLDTESTVEDGTELTSDPEDSSHTGNPVALSEHSTAVEQLARTFANAAGFPLAIVDDIALAGWLHDIGKVDRRFQILLRGGSEVEFYKDETPWAKSGMPRGARDAHLLAQQQSGYPKGGRHELQSLAMLEGYPELARAKAHDVELVLHLIASHHGFCRPFAPVVNDGAAVEVTLNRHNSSTFGAVDFPPVSSAHNMARLDQPVADHFWRSAKKYGWLELCWLEAILRLADHRASEREQASREGP